MPTKEMMKWFGQREVDVELMVRLGLLDPNLIVYFWLHDPSSPGFVGPVLPGYQVKNV
jgi:hypothetical protein